MSKEFSLQISQNALGQTVVEISGAIAENFAVAANTIAGDVPIEIDLGNVNSLNSNGIRSFKLWLASLKNPVIWFTKCPHFFINQVNAINNFLPPQSKIMSFYVPFYSSKTDEEKFVLFTDGQEITNRGGGLFINIPSVLDKTGHVMEMDIVSDKFFAFLRNQRPSSN